MENKTATPDPTQKGKLQLIWELNKPLVICIAILIILLIAAAIFAAVYFTVIKPS